MNELNDNLSPGELRDRIRRLEISNRAGRLAQAVLDDDAIAAFAHFNPAVIRWLRHYCVSEYPYMIRHRDACALVDSLLMWKDLSNRQMAHINREIDKEAGRG
jgi:hypothetical protein